MLIAMAGLRSTGKSELAEQLATRMKAVLVQVDALEEAIIGAGIWRNEATTTAAYDAAAAVARANLRNGLDVIVDAANYKAETRALWVGLADELHVDHMFLVTTCSDQAEHQRRIEHHRANGDGSQLTWEQVIERNMKTAFWGDEPRLAIDTSKGLDVDHVMALVASFASDNQPVRISKGPRRGARRAQA